MKYLIMWGIAFVLVFLIYLFFVVLNKKKLSKIFKSQEALIIKKKFDVTFDTSNPRLFALIVAVTNAFICATAYIVMQLFTNIYLGFLAAVLVLALLILSLYYLIGYFYKKKEGKKDV